MASKIRLGHARINHLDGFRIEAQHLYGIAAGAFGNGDQAGGPLPDQLGEALLGRHVGGLVEFGQEPAGHVVQSGGQRGRRGG